MDKGELVPDGVTISMIRDRLTRPDCEKGAILDGFPRTPVQADALEVMLSEFSGQVDAVWYITADEKVLVERTSGRWTCRASGHIYHEKFSPPKKTGVCDQDGSELYQRDDDTVETVTKRIKVYFDQTAPLVNYYRQLGKLVEIDGMQTVEHVADSLLSVLKK
jgi:adenylate kinase